MVGQAIRPPRSPGRSASAGTQRVSARKAPAQEAPTQAAPARLAPAQEAPGTPPARPAWQK
jgi:hypothetical protein